jgi:hypothetical protein
MVARGFVAEVHWFLACFAGLCLALDRLFVELAKGMLFVERRRLRMISCGIVIGLIISQSLPLVLCGFVAERAKGRT